MFPLMLFYVILCMILQLIVGYDISVFILIIIIILGCQVSSFAFLELFFCVVLIMLLFNSSTFERSGSVQYLLYFSLVVRFVLIGNFDISIITFCLLLVILAKLPLWGLHIWLPKVHAEASMLGSVFLAGVILKGGSILLYFMGLISIVGLIGAIGCVVYIYRIFDSKQLVALSSVLHISLSVIYIGFVLIVGFSHILVSPLMFVGVYYVYINNGTRGGWSISPDLILVNIGFILIGRFYVEIYMAYLGNILIFVFIYFMSCLFAINLYKRSFSYIYYVVLGRLLCFFVL